jgi:hypothetical protein
MPRSMVKALIQGQRPARRLFIPLIFSLAAKLEDVPLPNFVANPTKIANSLVAIYQRLRPDGVTCYFDLLLVAEALGCRLDWSASPPAFTRPSPEIAWQNLHLPAGEVMKRGRIPVALEVVRRVQGTLRTGPVLLVGLPGPLLVMQQLFGQDIIEQLGAGDDDALDTFETLVEITRHLSQVFCLAGTHLQFFDEPAIPTEFLPDWEAALVAVWNTARFHGALPVLLTPPFAHLSDMANTPLLCLKPSPGEPVPLPEKPFALALPARGEVSPEMAALARKRQCALVTTDGEIPYTTEIQKLQQHVAALRSVLGDSSALAREEE